MLIDSLQEVMFYTRTYKQSFNMLVVPFNWGQKHVDWKVDKKFPTNIYTQNCDGNTYNSIYCIDTYCSNDYSKILFDIQILQHDHIDVAFGILNNASDANTEFCRPTPGSIFYVFDCASLSKISHSSGNVWQHTLWSQQDKSREKVSIRYGDILTMCVDFDAESISIERQDENGENMHKR